MNHPTRNSVLGFSAPRATKRLLSAKPVCGVLSLLALCASANAADWTGAVDGNWNTAGNWSGGVVPSGENAVVNTTAGNIATISSDISSTPVEILVGLWFGSGRLDHVAGTARTGAGNWMMVGFGGGDAVGTYNLANTAGTGGALTGFGQGSGTMNVQGNLQLGEPFGMEPGNIATVNINTSESLTVAFDLNVGRNGALGTLNLDNGTVTANVLNVGVNAGTGVFNQSGGAVSTNFNLNIGTEGGQAGTYNLNGVQD